MIDAKKNKMMSTTKRQGHNDDDKMNVQCWDNEKINKIFLTMIKKQVKRYHEVKDDNDKE